MHQSRTVALKGKSVEPKQLLISQYQSIPEFLVTHYLLSLHATRLNSLGLRSQQLWQAISVIGKRNGSTLPTPLLQILGTQTTINN